MKILKPVWRLVRRYWAELFAAVSLIALIVGVNPLKLGHVFGTIDWRIALVMVPVVLAVYLCRGAAWQLALRAVGEHVTFTQTQLIELAGQVMIILPMGDLARVAMVRNTDKEHGVGTLTATVALQELLFMLFVSFGALPRLAQAPSVALIMILTMLAFLSVFVILLWRSAYEWAVGVVEHFKALRRFDQQLHEIRPAFVNLCKPRTLIPIAFFQALAALLSFSLFFLALRSIGITNISYINAVFVLGVSYTFGAISFLPLGIGAFEGLLTVILLTLHIPAAMGAAAGLIYRGYNDVLMAGIGLPAILYVRRRQRAGSWRSQAPSGSSELVAAAAAAQE
ncbi:MAG: flippase-like domain-containing protein [Candidatus Dormibacteraeota bacterium]|nr:flippase-like domain-containing protein [Candidatus Dormibacteraeota bacterium]